MNDDDSPTDHTGSSTEPGALSSTRHALLLAYLAEHYEPCPSCEYELHGLTGTHCPECGQSLVLRVGLEHPNLAAYLVGLIALSATAGFGGLFTLFFIVISIVRGSSRGDQGVLAVFLTISIVCGGLVFVWVRNGGRIRRASRTARRLLAAGCCALPFVALLAVYVFLGAP